MRNRAVAFAALALLIVAHACTDSTAPGPLAAFKVGFLVNPGATATAGSAISPALTVGSSSAGERAVREGELALEVFKK